MGARARLYDALHDERKDIICTPTDIGNGGYTHKFFMAPRSVEDMVGGRDAIAEWARVTYGWMGRAPDYKAAFLATLGGNPDFYKRNQHRRPKFLWTVDAICTTKWRQLAWSSGDCTKCRTRQVGKYR